MNKISYLEILSRQIRPSCRITILLSLLVCASALFAQTSPTTWQVLKYSGLFEAVVERDPVALKQHIATSKKIDERDDYGRTALHVATYTANYEAMRLLLEAGANVNLGDGYGRTPLSLARQSGYTEMVAILTAAGAK